MAAIDKFTTDRLELEEVLVRQFRSLQELIALTKKERVSLLNEPELVPQIVEDKEVLLDSMGLLEDKCRKIVQELNLDVSLQTENTSIRELLPFFRPEDANRIKNLSEGIISLAGQARELNRANQAIAATKLEWLKATQEFLISLFQPDTGYRTPKGGQISREVAGLGVEIRA
jgi:flagellar biosynthesis/type III secretory pathway chaperone